MYLDDTVNEIVVNSVANGSNQKQSSPFPTLSRREKEILSLSEFMTNKEIGNKLFISEKTVKTHITNINKKLQF